MSRSRPAVAVAFAVLLAAGLAQAAPRAQPRSDALLAPRPEGGEYMGLYLLNKKVGYLFMELKPQKGRPGRAELISEFVFKANVGAKVSERRQREVRVFEAKPQGRLLSLKVEQKGDGGEQLLEATATPTGLRVIRKRPGQPNEVLNLPPSKETIEDADQARVALFRQQNVEGFITDSQDLETYRVITTLGEAQARTVGGVPVKLRKVTTLSEKEKVPIDSYIDEKGRLIELHFGATMMAVAESESVAKRLDQVEVFGLTRVVLPKPAPAQARAVPGSWTLVVEGLPDKFHQDTERQKFKKLPNGRVAVTLSAAAPKTKPVERPLSDPSGGKYLKTSIIVESDNPEIKSLAARILQNETDAYLAAKKINAWVYQTLKKDYGASADRATDVLRQLRGDCTEHSLLAVSLMRASGIPARRIDGVIYMENEDKVPALYWHEWVEVYVGEWVQMDPTFGQDVADPTHFGVGEEGNAEIAPLIGQLKVVEVR